MLCIKDVNSKTNIWYKMVDEKEPLSLFHPQTRVKDLRNAQQGDCEDFAYTKYKKLIEICEIDKNRLSMFVFFPNDKHTLEEVHAVTLVKTLENQVLVLDNLRKDMYSFDELAPLVLYGQEYHEDPLVPFKMKKMGGAFRN
jgi:predicted transglutaminase-like cysteine proteinase